MGERLLVLTGLEVTPLRQVPLARWGVVELPEGASVTPLDVTTLDGPTFAALERLTEAAEKLPLPTGGE